MIIAEFLGLFTKSVKLPVAEGVPATEIQATKKTVRYRYLVKCSTLEELADYVASQGEHISYLNDDPSKPLYYSSKLHASGWVELAKTKEGRFYPKDDLTTALVGEAGRLGGELGKAAAADIWEEHKAEIKALFPKKSKPVFTAVVITPPANTTADGELGQEPIDPATIADQEQSGKTGE